MLKDAEGESIEHQEVVLGKEVEAASGVSFDENKLETGGVREHHQADVKDEASEVEGRNSEVKGADDVLECQEKENSSSNGNHVAEESQDVANGGADNWAKFKTFDSNSNGPAGTVPEAVTKGTSSHAEDASRHESEHAGNGNASKNAEDEEKHGKERAKNDPKNEERRSEQGADVIEKSSDQKAMVEGGIFYFQGLSFVYYFLCYTLFSFLYHSDTILHCP